MRKSWQKNRDVKRKAKRGLFWCWSCDAYLIWEGQRCPVCKHRDCRKRNKKE